jgi:hypothetical protein
MRATISWRPCANGKRRPPERLPLIFPPAARNTCSGLSAHVHVKPYLASEAAGVHNKKFERISPSVSAGRFVAHHKTAKLLLVALIPQVSLAKLGNRSPGAISTAPCSGSRTFRISISSTAIAEQSG